MYQRYILRNGKRYGPYLYKSVRKGNKVISVFVSKVNVGRKRRVGGKIRKKVSKNLKRGKK